MKLIIQSLHFTATPELKHFVTEKVSRLSRFFEDIESANVCLKLDKSGTTDNKICEIRLAVPGNDLFAKRQCPTFEEATSETIEVLEQQIKKMKEKFRSL